MSDAAVDLVVAFVLPVVAITLYGAWSLYRGRRIEQQEREDLRRWVDRT